MSDYKKLNVWAKFIDFCTEVYKITSTFPKTEEYGLSSQLRRASVSIVSNIAEGSKRGTDKEYRLFLRTAQGSGAEIEAQIIVALRVGYISNEVHQSLDKELQSIMRMLSSLITHLSKTI